MSVPFLTVGRLSGRGGWAVVISESLSVRTSHSFYFIPPEGDNPKW